jgi:transposase
VLDIPEEQKLCSCGHPLVCIGEEVSERLQIIPQQVFVERLRKLKYACHECEGSGDEEKPAVRMAKTPGNIMPGSIASSGLLSFIFTGKYCDYSPYYRQEEAFRRIGVEISRQNMSNWQLRTCEVLTPLFVLLKSHLASGKLVRMDETRMQVMDEPQRGNSQLSYMWLARGGPPEKPVLWYEYYPTRSSCHITEMLEGFSGYLQSDGYEGYDAALKGRKDIRQVGCFAHARRKFFDAHKISSTPGAAEEALSQIKGLYTAERELREKLESKKIDEAEFLAARRERCEPILEAFRQWLLQKESQALPSSKLGAAVSYTLGQWPKLVRYLELAELSPDNNACERSIRPFVMGRKNWVLSGSPEGARSSCRLLSLIQSAKENKLNPYEYLKTVFERAAEMSPSDDWGKLLPWNIGS